jgi:hypothetical protein
MITAILGPSAHDHGENAVAGGRIIATESAA